MKVLFLSLIDINSTSDENIYMDLLNEFIKNGHNVFIASPTERKYKKKTHIIKYKDCKILKIRTGNIQKTNIIEKGISTLLVELQFKNAIKKYFKGVTFDLIIYATPPITFYNTIKYFKKIHKCKTYLMLKDIFPQNAVDLKMFRKNSIIYKYFRAKEEKLYKISDNIGCMSKKNMEYLICNNNYLDKNKIHILPNSITLRKKNEFDEEIKYKYKKIYNIPKEAQVFLYGGNLGKPQGIDFIIKCLKKVSIIDNCYFIICGNGTEYKKLEKFINEHNCKRIILIKGLAKEEYNRFINIADIGLIFLDYNFTIPNFPSRILSYMEKGLPILACTDVNTDIGQIIEENNFGWRCLSNDENKFYELVMNITMLSDEELTKKGNNSRKYLEKEYISEINYKKIISLQGV